MQKQIGRPRLEESKKNTTLRLYPSQRAKLEKGFSGSIQKAFDFLVEAYCNNPRELKRAINELQKQARTTKQRKKAS